MGLHHVCIGINQYLRAFKEGAWARTLFETRITGNWAGVTLQASLVLRIVTRRVTVREAALCTHAYGRTVSRGAHS